MITNQNNNAACNTDMQQQSTLFDSDTLHHNAAMLTNNFAVKGKISYPSASSNSKPRDLEGHSSYFTTEHLANAFKIFIQFVEKKHITLDRKISIDMLGKILELYYEGHKGVNKEMLRDLRNDHNNRSMLYIPVLIQHYNNNNKRHTVSLLVTNKQVFYMNRGDGMINGIDIYSNFDRKVLDGWLRGIMNYSDIIKEKFFYNSSHVKFQDFLKNSKKHYSIKHKPQETGSCTFSSHKLLVKSSIFHFLSQEYSYLSLQELEKISHSTYKKWTHFLREYTIHQFTKIYKLESESNVEHNNAIQQKSSIEKEKALEVLILTYLTEKQKVAGHTMEIQEEEKQQKNSSIDKKSVKNKHLENFLTMQNIIIKNPDLLLSVVLHWNNSIALLASLLRETSIIQKIIDEKHSFNEILLLIENIIIVAKNDCRVILNIDKYLHSTPNIIQKILNSCYTDEGKNFFLDEKNHGKAVFFMFIEFLGKKEIEYIVDTLVSIDVRNNIAKAKEMLSIAFINNPNISEEIRNFCCDKQREISIKEKDLLKAHQNKNNSSEISQEAKNSIYYRM